MVTALKTEEERIVCRAVFRNDDEEINRLLAQFGNNNTVNRRVHQEETKQVGSYNSSSNNGSLQPLNKASG